MTGAEAFARLYFVELNHSFRTGDPTRLGQLALPNCATCSAFAEAVSSLHAKGLRYGQDLAAVKFASAMDFTPASRRVLIELIQQRVPVVDAAGRIVRHTPKGTVMYVATLRFDDSWRISRLQMAKP